MLWLVFSSSSKLARFARSPEQKLFVGGVLVPLQADLWLTEKQRGGEGGRGKKYGRGG